MPKHLLVQFTPIRSCLVNLPPQWVSALLDQRKVPQNVMLELAWTPKGGADARKAYFGWSGQASKPLPPNSVFTHGADGKLDVLEMDPQLGTAIGLSEGQKITVEFCRSVPECSTVNVEPYTEDDWEILELHAGYVEENLLSQLRVVYSNQLFCVWIHGKTLVRLKVAEIQPKHAFVKLTSNTEVIVAPKVRKAATAAEDTPTDLSNNDDQAVELPHVDLRAMPAYKDANDAPLVLDDLSVYIHPENFLGQEIVSVIKVVPAYSQPNQQQQRKANGSSSSNADTAVDANGHDDTNAADPATPPSPASTLYAAIHLSKQVPRNHVFLGDAIRSTLNLADYDIIRLTNTTLKKTPLGALVFRPYAASQASNNVMKFGADATAQQKEKAQQKEALVQDLQHHLKTLTKDEKVVLTHGLVVSVHDTKGLLQFAQKKRLFGALTNGAAAEQPAEQYAVVPVAQLKSLQIDIGEEVQKDEPAKTKDSAAAPPVLGGVDKTFNKLLAYAKANVVEKKLQDALGVPGSGGALVTGSHGAGKTELVKKVLNSVHYDPSCLIYTMEINCAEIANERIPTLKDTMQKWFDEAAWHAPSVIFFDDIDRLIPAEVEHADSTRSRHLAELFTQMATTMTRRHAVMMVATAQQQQSIHANLITNHLFTELVQLKPPSRDERKQIMETIMEHGASVLSRSLPHIDLVSVASETEGYLASDLRALVERAVHEGAVRSIKEKMDQADHSAIDASDADLQLQLIQQDFAQAREGFVPASLRGVKLQSSGVMWSDIGGLNETRRTLLETLEWPTKYAAVFAQCPLRLRSGLLLYGYPGCGKTLLASAVAKECGLNFISVKGPEILNKYIGASEKSVRDLFERASAAKPCVLFFDEFDSIAPRRGHDSTGVTDRVVNQMLTQMDGAEGLDGVYVLAATSRPDLIDPALLRPGRLDKALLCGMPSFDERLEILGALASKMTLASEVDLNAYAEKTEGFSGADLQGFLYNAHLEAIHGAINIDSFKEQLKKEQDDKSTKDPKQAFVMAGGKHDDNKGPLTLAEKGHISQRLDQIKLGLKAPDTTSKKKKKAAAPASNAAADEHVAAITVKHLEKSLKTTRPSITAEEFLRLKAIYDEFVSGRTGELPSGEGEKGIGKRSTLG
ncbi:P-loop containing nucleoside triphosphate hydrolase protein [Gongronella butleri]|nr:P-loop containing nucleoside triphosphate hydrolase protein [Gongronella butleri]